MPGTLTRHVLGKKLFRLACVLVVLNCFTAVMSAQEFRAAWADVFHAGMGSSNEVDSMVSTLASGHYNVVIVQVLGYMDNSTSSHGAMWKSSILPWSSRVTSTFDPLTYLCQKAHASGIEVHAWLGGSGAAMYRVSTTFPPTGNSTLANHPEWFIAPLTNSEGGAPVLFDGNFALDMGSPDVQEYIVSIIRELVTNYPIDGINWDDELNSSGYNVGFGYPAYSQASYSKSGLARYRINTGITGTPSNTDAGWSNYRRRFKNELMARVQAEMQSIKTNPRQPLRHTSAALAYSPVPASSNFSTSVPYTYFCDWAGMLQNGWLDAVVPQTYSSSTFNSWASDSANYWQYKRQIFPGIGAYLSTDSTIATEITYTRSLGLKGNSIYSYAVANNSSPYNGDWWGYIATNLYTNIVSTPTMPWRNPATATEGIVWGRVKDYSSGLYVDDATVAVTGGATVKTDGNGYYVATLVPAVANGTAHLVTASKSGASQAGNPVALAGDVVRYDFLLNGGEPAVPSNLSATATSGSQIILTWIDNATNETAYVVSRGIAYAGPYTDIAVLAVNSSSYTNVGLNNATTYYYVVRSTNNAGTSANSAPGSATTFTNSPPVFIAQPQPQTVVRGSGAQFSASVSGTLPISFQWWFNGSAIFNATSATVTISNAQYSDGGYYSLMASNSLGTVTSSNVWLSVLSARPTIQLTNIWNIQAGSRNYVTSNSTERGICLNSSTGHALLVSRSSLLTGGLGIFILDANTGTQVGTLNINGISNSATFVLNKIEVADDSVIYGANLTTASSTVPFIIYRWAGEGAVPTVAYSGAPDGGTTARWGDTFSITGAGTNTRMIVSGSGATNLILFTTTDGTNFAARVINPTVAVSAAEFSKGLQIVGTNNFYSKNRTATVAKIYTIDPSTNSVATTNAVSPIDANVIAIAVVTNYSLMAGIVDDNSTNNAGHGLTVYDIFSPGSAVVISNYYFSLFGSGTNSSNGNFGGAVDTDGTRIVALDTQNGIVALQIVPHNPPPRINSVAMLSPNQLQFQLNADPGNFVFQASSDLTNWIDLSVLRTNGFYQAIDPVTNASVRFYRTKN